MDLTLAILSNPCPVIFVDTCALLDVIRAGFRKDVPVDVLSAAVKLVEDLNSGNPKIWVVATDNVLSEFREHRGKVLSELAAGLANLKAQLLRTTHAASIVQPERLLPKPNWIDDELWQRIAFVLDRLMASISIYQGTSACVLRARDRLRAGEPPSSKAKQEFKDCEIFEEFLELAQRLRAEGFGERMIFVSSNTSDYGRPPGAPRIQEDLLAHGAEYVSSLSWALSSIRNP